jgi:serine phosphatase RsbU (regulator of sigma subunit)
VGILPNWQARVDTLELQSQDTLLLTSDGLTEATVLDSSTPGIAAMLKQAGLWKLIKQQPPPINLDTLLHAIQGDNPEQEDDQTVLLLEVLA